MKRYTDEEIKEILEKHRHWILEDCEGWEYMKADLSYSDLSYSNLSGSDLRGSNLSGSDLSYSNLSYSNLCGSNLRGSNLSGSDLSGSDLRGSNLCGSEKCRKGVKLSQSLIGWKKCKNNVLVKLEIPRGAIVFSINNKKCRTDKAKVLDVIGADRGYSSHKHFTYYKGDEIEVYNFNCEYNEECGQGIHFFKTREEAEDYIC